MQKKCPEIKQLQNEPEKDKKQKEETFQYTKIAGDINNLCGGRTKVIKTDEMIFESQ